MKDLIALLNEPDTTVAVVGASDDPSKYGNVIYRDLRRKGFTVFAVNPNRSHVAGDEAFPRLKELPNKPTIVDIVVPPAVGAKVLPECLDLGLMNVWLQPGAESPENLAFLQERGFNYVAHACIMVERLKVISWKINDGKWIKSRPVFTNSGLQMTMFIPAAICWSMTRSRRSACTVFLRM